MRIKRKATHPLFAAIALLAISALFPGFARAEQAAADQRAPAGHVLSPGKNTTVEHSQRKAIARNARAQARPWSIEDALPENSSAITPRENEPKKPEIGRIPWQSGSVGFETKQQINPTEYPDGQKAPGVNTSTHQPPSYLGFSLSLPTTDKSIVGPLFGHSD